MSSELLQDSGSRLQGSGFGVLSSGGATSLRPLLLRSFSWLLSALPPPLTTGKGLVPGLDVSSQALTSRTPSRGLLGVPCVLVGLLTSWRAQLVRPSASRSSFQFSFVKEIKTPSSSLFFLLYSCFGAPLPWLGSVVLCLSLVS